MRHHPRRQLPARALAALRQWQDALDDDWVKEQQLPADQRRSAGKVADARWDRHRSTTALEVTERVLAAMASPDLARCMYCEHDRGCQIDHAEPKSTALHRTFEWENHVWSCGLCNLEKLARYRAGMVIPTVDDPLSFLDLLTDGRWQPSDAAGRGQATLDALPLLNRQELTQSRARGRRKVIARLTELAARATVTPAEIDAFREMVTNDPFPDVFAALLGVLRLPGAPALFPAAVVSFVAAHPEMDHWLAEDDDRRWNAVQAEITALTARIRLRREGDAEEA